MRQVVRGRLEGPSGQTVTKIFDRCRDAVTAAGARGRASPGEQGRGCRVTPRPPSRRTVPLNTHLA